MPVRILIADDDSPIRRLLRRLLEEHSGWEVCGEAEDGLDAVAKTGELAPDLVVLDLAMPHMNGLQAGRAIAQSSPALPMLLLTVQEVSNQLVDEARNAGFRGAVSKSTGSEVIAGVRSLLEAQSFFPSAGSDLQP